jgi:DNA mismatch repair protein MSH6
LAREKEMYSATKLLKELSEANYFKTNDDEFEWPETFKRLLSDHDSLGLTPKTKYELALNAMGGIVHCLKNCLIEEEVLTQKNFEIYEPVDNLLTASIKKQSEVKKFFNKQKYMVLDSISLTNLEILENNYDNTQSGWLNIYLPNSFLILISEQFFLYLGTLFEQIDYCNTAFGKRLLKYWLVNPLCDPEAINERLNAIEDLKSLDDDLSNIKDSLKSLPDLERLICKVHHIGNVNKSHPGNF